MDNDFIRVTVLKRERDWYIDKVKIVDHLPEGGAIVAVDILGYIYPGLITAREKAKLLTLRLRTGATVAADQEDGLIKWLKTRKPILAGPRENFWEHFRRMPPRS